MIDYRASEFGGCIKMLVAKRLGMKPHAEPPASMVKIFDRGHRHETACLASMAEDGWEITSQQREVILTISPTIRIVGHLDAVGYHPLNEPRHVVVEAKAPQAWRMFIEEMYSDDPSPMIQRYKWQLSAYMLADEREAVLVCLDETFQLRFHGIEVPFYTVEDFTARINMVEELVSEGYSGLPKFCLPREYPCQYFHLHEDEFTDFDIDSELDHAVDIYSSLRDAQKASQDKLDKAKDRLLEVMGARRKIQTEHSVVAIYNRKNTSYDYKKMRADGIDIDAYKTETESKDIPRVTKKGGSDAGSDM